MSPKRIGDSLSGPLCHLAIASGSLIRFFKVRPRLETIIIPEMMPNLRSLHVIWIQVIENELRGDFNRYKFHELDGHDFSKKNTTDRHNSTSSNSFTSVPSSSEDPEVKIEYLKFVGSQLLAVSENSNKMAVWNAARQGRWQQHSTPEKVLCLESVSTFVYMGSGKGQNTNISTMKYGLQMGAIFHYEPDRNPKSSAEARELFTAIVRRLKSQSKFGDVFCICTCKNRDWSNPLHRFTKISTQDKR